jgi:hypothetical protein
MGRKMRVRRGAAAWRKLFSRQSSGGLSVPEFCRREGINASLFRRWRSTLEGSEADRRVTPAAAPTVESPAPFIDLGDLRSGGPRVEIRLELGSGVTLSIARG